MSFDSKTNKRIAKNTLLLYFRQLLIMAVSLYTSRVLLLALGVADFGIYNVVGGVVAMFSFLMSTMASASQRYLSYDLAKGDHEKLNETFGLIMLTYILLAFVTVFLTESIAVWFLNTKMTIPPDRMVAANWVLQFSILTFIAHIFATPYMSVIISHEQMAVYAYISIADVILKLLIVYLVQVLLYDRLITYAVLMFLSSLTVTLSYAAYCHIRYKESRFRIFYERGRFHDIIAFAWWNMIGSLANILRSQGINVLLNMFFNPAVNAARGIAYQVNAAITQFYTNFYTAVRPQIVKSYASHERERMHNLIFTSTRLAFLLVFVIGMPFLFYTDTLLALWLKTPPEMTSLFVQVILVNALFEVLSMPLVAGLQAANKIKVLQLTVSLLYLLNLPISYVLLKMGYPAVTPMYVNIVIAIVSFIPRILICRKYINISIRRYASQVLLRMCVIALVGGLLSYGISLLISDDGLLVHVLPGTLLVGIGSLLVCYIIGLKPSERAVAVDYLKTKLKG